MSETSLFLVTSAIYTSYGEYSTKERIEQTKETISSIKKYAPNSKIILIDAGEKSVDVEFNVDLIDYTNNPIIVESINQYKNFLKKINYIVRPEVIIKSMLEILMFGDFLRNNSTSSYERVFKLNGRYKLNTKFNYSQHLDAKNKIVILQPYLSQHIYNYDPGVSLFSYMTRCWSFDSKLTPTIIKTYDKMKEDILSSTKNIIRTEKDIEHLLYKHLNKKIVQHIDIMGVEGYFAPLGSFIQE